MLETTTTQSLAADNSKSYREYLRKPQINHAKCDVNIADDKNLRSAVWTKKNTVDADEIFGPPAIRSKERHLEIDTGSIAAQIVDELVTTVQIDIEDCNSEVAMLELPIPISFSRVADENQEAVASRR